MNIYKKKQYANPYGENLLLWTHVMHVVPPSLGWCKSKETR